MSGKEDSGDKLPSDPNSDEKSPNPDKFSTVSRFLSWSIGSCTRNLCYEHAKLLYRVLRTKSRRGQESHLYSQSSTPCSRQPVNRKKLLRIARNVMTTANQTELADGVSVP